jgi:hypothetical protein
LFSIEKNVINDLRCSLLAGRAEAFILSAARFKWSMFGSRLPAKIPDEGVELTDADKDAVDDALDVAVDVAN